MFNLDRMLVDMNCPLCEYPLEVAMIDARLESRIFCPNCKSPIQLHDESGSVHACQHEIQRAIKGLADALRRFGK